MLLYGYSGRFSKNECKEIRRFADSKGLKIFCIGGLQGCCDKFIDVDPFTVIAYFQNAHYVITDTFHGTIMSVITHRRFVSVVREKGYGNSQKLTDLLERLGLMDRRVVSIADIRHKLADKIDYSKADKCIEQQRKAANEYLLSWIK